MSNDYLKKMKMCGTSVNVAYDDCAIFVTYKKGTTTATLVRGTDIIQAEAKCHPEDEFNLEIGTKLAVQRLFESTQLCNRIAKEELKRKLTHVIREKEREKI